MLLEPVKGWSAAHVGLVAVDIHAGVEVSIGWNTAGLSCGSWVGFIKASVSARRTRFRHTPSSLESKIALTAQQLPRVLAQIREPSSGVLLPALL